MPLSTMQGMEYALEQLRKRVEAFTGKCQFKNKCKYYAPDSVTRNTEASAYCGKYRNFSESDSK